MKRILNWCTVGSFLLTIVSIGFTIAGFGWALSFAITFGTFLYHFSMRLLVGHILNRIMQNTADLTKKWYQLRSFEVPLYKALKVKKWKNKMPSYDASLFDPKLHSWEEIAQAMCQAELVHEIIAVLSFLPLLAAIPFGTFGVFFVTSVLSALFDLSFAVMQRFNRPRVLRCLQATQKHSPRETEK